MALLGRQREAQAGSAAIEFALVAPVFLAMLLGILVYGLYFGLSHSVEQLAAQAARVSVAGLDDQERETLAEAYLTDNERRRKVLMAATKLLEMQRRNVTLGINR